MKYIYIALALFTSSSAFAKEDFFGDFFAGKYLLVGKGPDTEQTYTGKVDIYRDNGILKVKRVIGGRSVVGNVAFEPASDGDTKVLRFRYEQAYIEYEQTCLWQSDLDNYARISCYLYQPGVRTSNPGLEVLFHERTGTEHDLW
jgi:hypothetical protein